MNNTNAAAHVNMEDNAREPWVKPEPLLSPEEIAKLFADGYLQTSRKFYDVARLPEGKTGIEALLEAELVQYRNAKLTKATLAYWEAHVPKWANGMGELHAAKHYRCCHADRAGLSLTLDAGSFEALRLYTKARGVNFSWGKL